MPNPANRLGQWLGDGPIRWALYLGAFLAGSRLLLDATGLWTTPSLLEDALIGLAAGFIVGLAMPRIFRSSRSRSGA